MLSSNLLPFFSLQIMLNIFWGKKIYILFLIHKRHLFRHPKLLLILREKFITYSSVPPSFKMYKGREEIYYLQMAILQCDKSSCHQVGNVILKWVKSAKRGHFHMYNCSLISVISTVSFSSPSIACLCQECSSIFI